MGTLSVVVEPANPALAESSTRLSSLLAQRLTTLKLASKVVEGPAEGQAQLRITVIALDEGNGILRAMNLGGEAEVTAEVELVHPDEGVVAKATVTGNSARQSTVSINGVNTSWFDSLSGRAINATCEQIEIFLGAPE